MFSIIQKEIIQIHLRITCLPQAKNSILKRGSSFANKNFNSFRLKELSLETTCLKFDVLDILVYACVCAFLRLSLCKTSF
jgi:hypothetical protein